MTIPGTDLPARGAKPWYDAFVSAWNVLRGRVKDHDDIITSGRLSEQSITSALNEMIDGTRVIWITSSRFPSLALGQGEGVDLGPALQALVDALPSGHTVIRYAQGGTGWIKTPVNFSNRSIELDFGPGGDIVLDIPTGTTAFTWATTHGSQRPVTSLTQGSVDVDGVSKPGIIIEMPVGTIPGNWSQGTAVKIIGDNLIPGARTGSGGKERRVGQFFTIHTIVGTTITCLGTLTDPITTNVRVSSMTDAVGALTGGSFRASEAALTEDRAFGVVDFVGRINPRVENVSVKRTVGSGFKFTGCFGYRVSASSVLYARNKTSAGIYGYAVLNNCSEGGVIEESYKCRGGRHAYTDDVPEISAGDTSTHRYGRPRYDHVRGQAHDTLNTAWDTHHGGEGHTFDNVLAVDCYNGVAIRSRYHRVVSPSVLRADAIGVMVFNEDRGGETYGIEFIGTIDVDGCAVGLRVDINGAGTPSAGVREKRSIRGARLSVRNFRSMGIEAANIDMLFDSISTQPAPTTAVELSIAADPVPASIAAINSSIVAATHVIDQRQHAVGTLALVSTATNAFVHLTAATILTSETDGAARLTTLRAAADQTIPAILLDHKFIGTAGSTRVPSGTHMSGPKSALTRYQWVQTYGGDQSSAYASFSNAEIEADATLTSRISHIYDPAFIVRAVLSTTTARTAGLFPDGSRRGQQMVVLNHYTSLANLTISNDRAAKKTMTASGAAVVLAPGRSATFEWMIVDGSGSCWVQIA